MLIGFGRFGFPLLAQHLVPGGTDHRSTAVNTFPQFQFEPMRFGPIPGKPIEEKLITLTGKPKIKTEKDYNTLILPTNAGSIEVIYSPGHTRWEKSLSPEAMLTFTLWQRKRVTAHSDSGKEDYYWDSKIETISEESHILYDARICSLHRTMMTRGDVEISYGLPCTEFFEAFEHFSGGPGFVLGGCCVEPEKTTKGYRCAECIRAYQKWSEEFETSRGKK